MKRKNCFVTLIAVACLLFVGCAKKYTFTDIDFGPFANTKANMKIIENVYGHFIARVEGKSRIEKVGVTLRNIEPSLYELYLQEEYGWYTEMEITIKIADDDKTIYERLPMARNNLFYFFGGGIKPGMSILKDHSAYFYGFKKNEITPGETTFVPDDFYKIVDTLALE